MIFVDTGAWYDSLVPTDPNHPKAAAWLSTNRSRLLTTDYVIDETLTLLRVRGERKRALLFGARLLSGELAEVHKITAADLTLAWETFERFDDKDWSFTDCTSRVVIENAASLWPSPLTVISDSSARPKYPLINRSLNALPRSATRIRTT